MGILGAFLALKAPGGRESEFCQSKQYCFYNHNGCLRILGKFQKNLMDEWKGTRQKVPILAILGLFRAFFTPFGALGTQLEFSSKKALDNL